MRWVSVSLPSSRPVDGEITGRFVVVHGGAVVWMSIKIERRAITEIDSASGVGAPALPSRRRFAILAVIYQMAIAINVIAKCDPARVAGARPTATLQCRDTVFFYSAVMMELLRF